MYVVFYRSGCPYSMKALNILNQRKEHIITMEIETRDEFERLKQVMSADLDRKIETVPQIFLDGVYIGGCSDLVEYLDENDDFVKHSV